MKALSLTQPWATLVAIGAKCIETRSWHTYYRGEVAIHASKGFPQSAREIGCQPMFARALGLGGFVGLKDLPLGAIVAVGRIVDVRTTVDEITDPAFPSIFRKYQYFDTLQEREFGDYSRGRWAWLLCDVQMLPEPVAIKGALRLWTVPAEIERQVRSQLLAVTR